MQTALDIASYLDQKYPQHHVEIQNLSDIHLGVNKALINQYIFGLTGHDPGRTSVEHYKDQVRKSLEGLYFNIEFVPTPFEDYELDDLESVLTDLASHYHAKLDIPKMIGTLNITHTKGEIYYLVVIVVQILVIQDEN
jgi:hypothetical protein